MESCQQIITRTETILTIKNSKFIAIAEPANSAAAAEQCVDNHRANHPKANHHCYAYRIGASGAIYRANDDGEPSGTAGQPIYRQLQSFQASNTVLTVIRYFGGILLGAGGLVKAYKHSARQVLEQAEWQTIVPMAEIVARCDYAAVHVVMKNAERAGFVVTDQHLDLQCELILQGASADAAGLCQQLRGLNIGAEIRAAE